MYHKYLWYVIRHRWFVMIACFKRGLFWRGIKHDWSKFLPSEFFPYARHFYGPNPQKRDASGYYKPTDTGDSAFDFAWMLHQKRNRHHWQWWLLPEDDGGTKVLEMTNDDILEMVSDWDGAGRAISGKEDTAKWYSANNYKMQLHPRTRDKVQALVTGGTRP